MKIKKPKGTFGFHLIPTFKLRCVNRSSLNKL